MFLLHIKNNSFKNFGSTVRAQTAWIEGEILHFSSIEFPNALPFISQASAIFSCAYRDSEKIPDNSLSGSHILQQIRTACHYWKWNNNTSSQYRSLYPGICSPPRPDVLPRTREVRSWPFHRGKQTQSNELHIYSIWGGSENVYR